MGLLKRFLGLENYVQRHFEDKLRYRQQAVAEEF